MYFRVGSAYPSASGKITGPGEIILLAGAANENIVTVDFDGANSFFIATNVTDSIYVLSGGEFGFGKPTRFA
jgi:hypothetical protein